MRALRERRGLTQPAMAAWINERTGRRYDKQRISRWETGGERIPRDVAGVLAIAAIERPPTERTSTEPPRRALTVAIGLQKGGVGKTATSVNLAYVLARAGNRVLLVDADSQGNATAHVGIGHADIVALSKEGRTLYHALVRDRALAEVIRPTGVPGLDLVPSSIALAAAEADLYHDPSGATMILREKLAEVQAGYDVIVIDCAPNLGMVTINALTAADQVLIPCQTEPHAIFGLEHLYDTISRVQRRTNPRLAILGILPTMYNARLSQDRASLEDLHRLWGGAAEMFDPVPRATVYPQSAAASAITLVVAPDAPGLDSYIAIATRIMEAAGRTEGRHAAA